MELKLRASILRYSSSLGSNRTFMELKYAKRYGRIFPPFLRSNRTFMELKSPTR